MNEQLRIKLKEKANGIREFVKLCDELNKEKEVFPEFVKMILEMFKEKIEENLKIDELQELNGIFSIFDDIFNKCDSREDLTNIFELIEKLINNLENID